jgi:hypothetical protein
MEGKQSSNNSFKWYRMEKLPQIKRHDIMVGTIFIEYFIGIPGEFITPPESEQWSYNNTYTEQSMPIYVGLLNILSTIPAIVSTFFFIRIIRQISAWQENKSGKSI